MENKKNDILQLFSQVTDNKYEVTGSINKLGGMNNNNYMIRTALKDLVFRLPGKGSNESVNRVSEYENSKLAFKIGLDSNMIYFDKKSGLKITEYIENAETLNVVTAKEEINMKLMADSLNVLHKSEIHFHSDFNPFAEIKEYRETIYRENKDLLGEYKALEPVMEFLKKETETMEIEYVPCHLDAWPENFVKNTDEIYLIDWEYSSNYDRLWDVVSIGLECEYSKDEEELFMEQYFGKKASKKEIEKMGILRILMDVYWSMWSLAKVSCGEDDLYGYSISRYKRGIFNLEKLNN